jgi:hypothetical protein
MRASAPATDDAAGFVEGLNPFRRLQPALLAADRPRHPDDPDRDVVANDRAAIAVSIDVILDQFKLVHAAHPFNM